LRARPSRPRRCGGVRSFRFLQECRRPAIRFAPRRVVRGRKLRRFTLDAPDRRFEHEQLGANVRVGQGRIDRAELGE
jgi:hypothetical protein